MSARGAGGADIRLKRAYLAPSPDDGARILVERLWPRGLAKARAVLDGWEKEVAPSAALRRWYGHAPDRWPEFRRRYREELRALPEPLARLRELAAAGPLTLVLAAHDVEHSSAAVLREALLDPAFTKA